MFGMAGLAMLIPLAVTSNNFSIRRLGKNWIWLHRLVIIIAACGALHFALSTKILDLQQYIYVGLIIALILYRSYRPIARSRKKGQGRTRNRAMASAS
jgi:sulfoxide reductase heme-binding subunit YedZ